mmetsp:Transcript_42610/g.110494  ORF Transcript_42610/g.110494 Transcript_42610/m.110494 type:complete len:354 (-) Transcript_42610:93-1154(-)|eukprot:jgi/Tetstr1/425474/TSEL_015921.t1
MVSGPVAMPDGTVQMDAVDPKATAEVDATEIEKLAGAVKVVVKVGCEQSTSGEVDSIGYTPCFGMSFADTFDHRVTEGKPVQAKLAPEEEMALQAYRDANGLQPKSSWVVAEIPESSGTEKQMLYSFREKLISHKVTRTPEAAEFCTDITMLRYLRARNMSMDKAQHMLEQTIQWRAKTQPRQMSNDTTRFNAEVTDVRIMGMDEHHRPVIFQSYTGSSDHSAAALKMNNICIMEKAMQCMSAHTPHSVVFVYDLGAHRKNGLTSIKDQARVASAVKKVTKIFQDHYPEMLSLMVFINPPGVYEAAYQMVRPFIDPKTASKVLILHDDDMMPQLRSTVGDSMASNIFKATHQA